MSLRLVLTRHAKSSWASPGLGDHERPLNKRGRASADAIGDWLQARDYLPGEALISSAARTRETWARIADRLAAPPAPTILPGLYLADPEAMLALLRAASAHSVMLIAHNPGSAAMAALLAIRPPEHQQFHRYPTAATTVFSFEADSWADVTWQSGRVIDFVVPRDLLE
ncbi:MAG TPA: histidine phosphatase family protein [Aliiroseovarius sp.]|nr:histidine phosphatase family protein [Aliiroseovarius sp.]